MVKTTGPVDGNVALLPVQSRSSFHAATGADAAELEQPIKDRTVVADVVFPLLAHVAVHVIRGDLLEEVDVVVGMELGHFASGRGFGALVDG